MILRQFLILLIVTSYTFAQQKSEVIRDTSYTVYSTYVKLKGKYPFIKIVKLEMPPNISSEYGIVYQSYGERQLRLDIFYPSDSTKLYPAVLMIHGGGWKSGDRSLLIPMAKRLAAEGFVTATIEYRLSQEAGYPAAVFDIKAAIKWLRANSKKYLIDTNKITVLGTSAGGHLAALVGVTNGIKNFEQLTDNPNFSSDVQAIVDIDGILDFTDPAESGKDTNLAEPSVGKLWFGYTYEDNPSIWIEASPLTYVNEKTPPMEFINSSFVRFHAGRDEAIEVLNKYEIYYEVHTLPDSPHSFWLFHPWFEPTCEYVINFLYKVFKR